MPSLAQATSKTVEDLGYTRLPAPTGINAPAPTLPDDPGLAFMRTPLPPISTTPDAIRQFKKPGIPQFRIIPPATQPTGGSSSTTTTSSGGGGGTISSSSTTVVTTQAIKNASVTTPMLSQNQSTQAAISMSTVFALLDVSTNAPARIRLYSTKAAQIADLNRSASTPVVIGSENGIIADFLLVANTELSWTCSPAVVGFNDDNPRASVIYVTVTNPNPSSVVLTVSFTYAVIIT